MAGRALTPAGVILKWILIPVACAAFGFYAIGAKIGRFLPSMGSRAVEVTPVADNSPSPTRAQQFSKPEVRVAAHLKPRRH